MRIIAKTHRDYYDSAQALGQDQGLLYVRDQRVFGTTDVFDDLLKTHLYLVDTDRRSRAYRLDASPAFYSVQIIGFCGKIYPSVTVAATAEEGMPRTTLYKAEDVHTFVRENVDPKKAEIYFKKKKWRGSKKFEYYGWCGQHKIDRFFENCLSAQDKYMQKFMEASSPILVGRVTDKNAGVYADYELKSLEFFKVFDPFQAFQEISMFLGGMASPEKPIPPVSNDDMRDAKGFDKWSFRKEPK